MRRSTNTSSQLQSIRSLRCLIHGFLFAFAISTVRANTQVSDSGLLPSLDRDSLAVSLQTLSSERTAASVQTQDVDGHSNGHASERRKYPDTVINSDAPFLPERIQQQALMPFDSASSPAEVFLASFAEHELRDNWLPGRMPLESPNSVSSNTTHTNSPQPSEIPPPPPPPPSNTSHPNPQPTSPPLPHHLAKRATGCGTHYSSCAAIGYPQLCCTTTAHCSIDYAGAAACCPIGAVCTGSAPATQGTQATQAVGTTTASSTAAYVGLTTTTTQGGVQTSAGFIQAAGSTVVVITSGGAEGRRGGLVGGGVRLVAKGVRIVCSSVDAWSLGAGPVLGAV